VIVNPTLSGGFTIDGLTGEVNGQVGSSSLQAIVTWTGGTGPWYAVTIYSGTDSLCSGDTSVFAGLDDITATEAILTFPEPSTPSSITYYCATITDNSFGGYPVSYGPIQVDVNPALSTPTLALSTTSLDYGVTSVTITATVTWAGGTAPYFVYLLSGSSSNCALDDQPVTTVPAGTPTSPYAAGTLSTTTFTFGSPASTTYYCAVVLDSSTPPSKTETMNAPFTVESLLAVNPPTLSASAVEVLTPLYEGNTITATLTWSGGTGPFDVEFYGPYTAAACSTATPVVTTPGSNPLTGVTGYSAMFSFLAPNPSITSSVTYYYCATVTDATANTATSGTTSLIVSPPLAVVKVTLYSSGPPLGPPGTDIGQTESATANVTWSGGNALYKVTLSSGNSSLFCSLDDKVVSSLSGTYATTTNFVFASPTITTYYCASVTDASVPVSGGSTALPVAWTDLPGPTVSLPPDYEIAAGSSTTITATIVTPGVAPDFLQWFLGPACDPHFAITGVLPAATGSSYFTGVITQTTTYSVQITDSSKGTPAASYCAGIST
jgi:hypothetical protein